MIVGKGAEMIAVIRNNRYIRRRKKSYKELRAQFVNHHRSLTDHHKEASPELLGSIRKRIIKENRVKFMKDSIALIIAMTIVIWLAIVILKAINYI